MGRFFRWFLVTLFIGLSILLLFQIYKFHINDPFIAREENSESLFMKLNYTPSRFIPFWFWNGNMTPHEIKRQIKLMHDIGVKEVMIHARSGLTQEYLSQEWFNIIGSALDELKKQGMRAWIYDELDWPSGRANGKVLQIDQNLRQKDLKEIAAKEQKISFSKESIIISVINIKEKKKNLKDKYCNDHSCDFNSDFSNDQFLIYYQDLVYYTTEYSNQYYVDLLNPKTTSLFINLTHEQYYSRFKDHFGNTIIGFFTDEPGFYNQGYDDRDYGSIPWTDGFIIYFQEKNGYDIRDYLYYIWHEGDTSISKKIKIDYFDTLTKLYSENYFKKLHDWTNSHNVLLIGHVLIEESIPGILAYEGDYFRTAKYLDIPGSDDIASFNESKITPYLVKSAAYIFNKPYTLTEAFGGYGDNLSYKEVLKATEWLNSNGIDIIVPHAFFYTTDGKMQSNDYMPSFFWQNELLWPHMADYITKLGEIKSCNEIPRERIIYPIREAWSAFNPKNNSKTDQLDRELKEKIFILKAKNISFILVPDYMVK